MLNLGSCDLTNKDKYNLTSITKKEVAKVKFDHIGIVVKDLEKAIEFYSGVFGFRQPKTGPYSRVLEVDKPGYKLRYVLLSANGVSIELLEPKEGPWTKRLEEKGEGAICELCIEVDDIEEFHDKIKKMGITPVGRFGQSLVEEKYVEAPSGARFIYLPLDKTYGTLIEVLERPWKSESKS